ncbi:MAG: PDZ domain-containing protein [Akkermansiaceae bacterium]|nr:PDZ domain-containing protein [Akkermansiaceae bacterium]
MNDILLSIDETKLSTPADLRREIGKHEVGDIIQLKVLRKGQRSDISVTLEEKKKDDNANEPGDKPAKPDGQGGPNADDKNEVHIEIDGKGGHASATATAESSSGSSLEEILDDPNVPENFKKSVREMRDRMREFEDKHGIDGDKDKNRGDDGNRVD